MRAFRTTIGLLRILNVGVDSPSLLIAQAVSLAITTSLLTAAIAIGLAAPLAFN